MEMGLINIEQKSFQLTGIVVIKAGVETEWPLAFQFFQLLSE
jgi:hypothetical protein